MPHYPVQPGLDLTSKMIIFSLNQEIFDQGKVFEDGENFMSHEVSHPNSNTFENFGQKFCVWHYCGENRQREGATP